MRKHGSYLLYKKKKDKRKKKCETEYTNTDIQINTR